MSQRWLSHFVGQDDATLPERHLLPRVQYLLASEKAHKLTIPNPIADIDPRADLQMPAAPDDPLRFEAYWPNEDSPLEDLILLRPDDERLSVKAWVAGGVGEIEVYWVLDGRLNHRGLASDDVELLPGKHDDARLYAVGEGGQVVFVELPRVVKLPKAEIPEMVYGINDYNILRAPYPWAPFFSTSAEIAAAAKLIADLGLGWIRVHPWFDFVVYTSSGLTYQPANAQRLDHRFQILQSAGLEILPQIGTRFPLWAGTEDITQLSSQKTHSNVVRDPFQAQARMRAFARRWQEITVSELGNEPNIEDFWLGTDPIRFARIMSAQALGIWYENPSAIIVGPSLCCFFSYEHGVSPIHDGYIDGHYFLEALYDAGLAPFYDILAIHYPSRGELERFRSIMRANGEGDKPLWVTETGDWMIESELDRAEHLSRRLHLYAEHPGVHGAFVFYFRDTLPIPWGNERQEVIHLSGIVGLDYRDGSFELQPTYWAVHDFLRAQRGE